MGVTSSSPSGEMSGAVTNAIRQRISQNTVVIYSKTYCPYCTMAKEVFDKLRQPYDLIELDQVQDSEQIQDALGKMTGTRTVPRVFIKGQCIGGGTDTQSLYKQGKLQEMLK
ncbi:hypothetical protein GHT06_012001 [Daphnia sinensis]|uniref:Glutaredoxin-2, mitochondrial n=1 Tax=Daphnia sinensis TaxID=1820382 RepID=A0AAD5PZG4_9CRUS|nr:hypothetical protein GHT06_012001 [Daphnia sinensis]